MARLTVGVPVTTETPTLQVDAGLRVGRHTFRLVVVDDDGNVSAPAEMVVRVVRRPPTPRPPNG
jgi:hypothetical protein